MTEEKKAPIVYTGSEEAIISVVSALADMCYSNSKAKGFWKEQDDLIALVNDALLDASVKQQLLRALNDAFHAMKGDLMHSELGERTEAQRKSLPSDKLPAPFTGEEEELADCVIRILDYAGRRRMKLGEAIVLKMRYNSGRPYMHGKQF